MNPISAEEYNAVVNQWKEWQSYPWGKLLYTISHQNLLKHLIQEPLQILDVGGGNGLNSIFFAQLGHSITLIDYSPVMINEARQAAEKAGVTERITFCQTNVETIQEQFPNQQFDLILCHLMIEFVLEPEHVLQKICTLLAPDGMLSILDANRYSEVYRIAFQTNDLTAADKVLDTKQYYHPWFKQLTPLYASAEMITILEKFGCEAIGNYGIRCLCDYLPNEPKYEAQYFETLKQLESNLTNSYPYKLLARFYQVIVQKMPV